MRLKLRYKVPQKHGNISLVCCWFARDQLLILDICPGLATQQGHVREAANVWQEAAAWGKAQGSVTPTSTIAEPVA